MMKSRICAIKMGIYHALSVVYLASSICRCYLASASSPSFRQPEKWLLSNLLANGQALTPDLQNVEFESLPALGKEKVEIDYQQSTCQLVQIAHLLHQTGCQSKAIASFACLGSCQSYVQTSTSKFWQHERSCSCCQQTGLREATFTLDCPSLDPPYKKVKTYAPVDCLCRACTDLGKENLQPQELVEAMAGGNLY